MERQGNQKARILENLGKSVEKYINIDPETCVKTIFFVKTWFYVKAHPMQARARNSRFRGSKNGSKNNLITVEITWKTMMANYDAKNINNFQKRSLKGSLSEEVWTKAIQKGTKRCKREPQVSHEDAKREPEGAKSPPCSIYLCFTGFKGDQGHPAECKRRP